MIGVDQESHDLGHRVYLGSSVDVNFVCQSKRAGEGGGHRGECGNLSSVVEHEGCACCEPLPLDAWFSLTSDGGACVTASGLLQMCHQVQRELLTLTPGATSILIEAYLALK